MSWPIPTVAAVHSGSAACLTVNLVVEGKAVDAPVESGGDVPGCTESTDWSSCSKIIRRKTWGGRKSIFNVS